jgi:hypothetical protein
MTKPVAGQSVHSGNEHTKDKTTPVVGDADAAASERGLASSPSWCDDHRFSCGTGIGDGFISRLRRIPRLPS